MKHKLISLMVALAVLAGLFSPLAPPAWAPRPVVAAPSTWCIAGGFQGWDNASMPLYDDGTHGDILADDNIFSLDTTIAAAGRYEFKVVTCGDWGTAYPSSNSWFFTSTANQAIKFTFDANDHSTDAGADFTPAQHIVNVWGDDLPTEFTAVGDWQGWANPDPATAMTAIGHGLYWLKYTIPTAGAYMAKVVRTSSWDEQYCADGRNVNGPTINFMTTADNQEVIFLLDTRAARVAVTVNQAGTGNWCVAGSMNGWDNSSTPLFDDGTNGDLIGGDGVFSLDLAIATAGRYEFKAVECGNWGIAYPSDNAWLNTTADAQVVKFTFDTNDHSTDAGTPLYPLQNIVNAWDSLPASLTAVGNFQGWNNADPATALTDLGHGFHMLYHPFAAPGDYMGKMVKTGTWDAFGADGRNKNALNFDFTVYEAGDEVLFWVDAYEGRAAVVPPPPPEQASHDNNIWWDDLYHDSLDPLYRTPGGAVTANTAVTLRFRAAANDLTAVKVRLWNDRTDTQTFLNMAVVATDATYDWWEVTVPASADPTSYWYRFIAMDGTATAYYEDNGKGFAGGFGGPGQPYAQSPDNSWQITVYDPSFHTPDWVKNGIIYQIFPERFRDGDLTNDTPPGSFHYDIPGGSIYRSNDPAEAWNAPLCDPRDPEGPCPQIYGQNFYGGDLQGIIDQLDYLADLGVTAIYMNPIFTSPSNHKYDTTNYGEIDPAFGDLADFQTLTSEAATRGISVILDGVFNHTSSDSIYFDRYHRYTEVGACESNTSPYRDWYYFTDVTPGTGACAGSDGTPLAANYESWWGYDSLPKLRANTPAVRDLIWAQGTASIGPYWISEGADGWRFDVGGDVDPGTTGDPTNDYWEGFRNAVRTVNPETYLVGEEWGNSTSWLLGNEWDASMNYQFGTSIKGFYRHTPFTDNDHNSGSSAGIIAPLKPSQLEERLRYLEERNPPEAFYAMLNLLDSHDTNRALFFMDHNAAVGTDPTLLQNPTYDWSDAMTRLMGVALLQFTLPGAPTIYYGDEVGLVGPTAYSGGKWEDDPYNRLPFPWLDESGTPFYTHLQSGGAGWTTLRPYYQLLAATRKAHAALRTGSFDTLLVDDANDIYSYGRLAADDAAVIIANRGATQAVTVDVSGYLAVGTQLVNVLDGNALYTVAADGSLTVPAVPTLSGALLVLTGTLATPPAAVTDLAIVAERGGELDLAWTAATGADSYDLYRSLVSGGGYEFVANVNGTAYTDTGLQNAVTYYYVLISKDDATLLTSGYSNEASGMPHYTIGWANLQGPSSIVHTLGITPTENIYGQVWIDGVTSAPGATPGLLAQVGFGPDGSNPASDPAWTWVDAVFHAQAGNNDEFKGQLLPEFVGEYDYAYRYSTTGGRDWVYADLDGIGNDYDPAQAGALTVNPAADITPPATPLNLRVTTWSAESVSLEWDPVADADLYAYDLYREEAGGTPAWLARVLAPGVTYVDTDVTTGQTYTYTVQALDTAFNRSAFSNPVSATPLPRVVELRFIVDVPAFTPATDTVYIAGNNAAVFGASWNPSAQPLTKIGANTWRYEVTTDEGLQLEYKYTRGTWDVVENWGTLVGTNNRSLTTDYGTTGVMTVTNTVHNWRDVLPMATYPANGATNWDPTHPISVTFNRELNTSLITTGTFLLEQLARASLPGTFSFSTFTAPYADPDFGDGVITGTLLLFDPDADLPTSGSYRVRLVKGGFAYGDGAMQQDFSFTFGPPSVVTVHRTTARGSLPLGLAVAAALGLGVTLLRRRRRA